LCCLQNRLTLQRWVCLQKKLPSQNDRCYKCRNCKLVVWRRNCLCNDDVSVCRKMLSKESWTLSAKQNLWHKYRYLLNKLRLQKCGCL
jgi:hypothetical protein